jgi:aminoglycoside 6-adenylyltransferase
MSVSETSLLGQILAWAEARPDIRAVVMTGSTVRDDGSADGAADLDIELFTTAPELYASTRWMGEIRPVWVQLGFEPDNELDYRNRLTIFEGGQKVDFRVAPIVAMERMVSSGVLDEVYERGYRVLFDKDGITAGLPPPTRPAQPLPSAEEYRAVIDEFWFEAWHIPKYTARDELWVVKFRDWTMKELLRRMLEWNALARDPNADVWYIGTKMKDWVTPVQWRRLQEIFGHFDAGDSLRALHATCSLFSEVARDVGDRLGYTYPSAVERSMLGYVEQLTETALDMSTEDASSG